MRLFTLLGMLSVWLVAVDASAEDQAPASGAALTVMSFNIRYGSANDGENHWDHRKERVAETIQKFNPDLLGTQETIPFQRDFLAENLPDYAVHSAGREDGKEKGETCALFYRKDRFEKLDGGHFWLSETPDQPGSKSWDSSLPRLVSWVKLRDKRAADSRPIVFMNTHFDHRGQQARLKSAEMVRQKALDFSDADIIVTGDFNAGEGSAPYVAMFGTIDGQESPLVDTYRVANPEKSDQEGTFSGFKAENTGGNRIDWIAVSRGLKIENAEIDRTQHDGRTPSDHLPVTAKLSR